MDQVIAVLACPLDEVNALSYVKYGRRQLTLGKATIGMGFQHKVDKSLVFRTRSESFEEFLYMRIVDKALNERYVVQNTLKKRV